MSRKTVRLAGIAAAAGAFSGLFGVGGGSIIVPLLILWVGFEERAAAGTSLSAIVPVTILAAATHGLFGNVEVLQGVLVGLPAVAGVVAGTALQQRLEPRLISGIFAVVLVASAVVLVV